MAYFQTAKGYVLAHKFWSACIAIVIVLIGWWAWGHFTSTSGQTRYIVGTVMQGTLIASVSESGQVTANDQLNITPQASGEIIGLYVRPGQSVNAGASIATIDPTSAQEGVQSAKENLTSAQLALAKLQEAATTLTLTEQQDALSQSQQALLTLYQTSFSDITSSFLDLPTMISGVQDVDLGNEAAGPSQSNLDYYLNQAERYNTAAQSYHDAAYSAYEAARTSYNQTFSDFEMATSTPDQASITNLLNETQQTTSLMATAIKSANDFIQFYSDQLTQNGSTPKPIAATQLTTLNGYLVKAQSHLNALLSDINGLQSDQENILEKQQTLTQTQAGPDPIDVQSDQLNVTKAQEALQQAQVALANCYVTAPFAGVIASVPVNLYDQASSGTTIASLITTQQYADLSLNEVDAAKIQLGESTTLTFDAIPDLTLTGKVAEIDPVGTVSQGVVTYDVRVGFDTQDPRVKTGMSINANIETAVHQNVLEVPASAVKTQNGNSYVQVFNPPIASSTIATAGTQGILSITPPQNVPVQVGISDGTNTEITSGLSTGQQIVTRTISGSTPVAAAAATTGGAGAARGGVGLGGATGGAGIRL